MRSSLGTSRRVLCAAVGCASILLLAATQEKDADPSRLTFEVASIHPTKPGGDGRYIVKPVPGGQGYMAQGTPVKLLIALMYKIPATQIEGGPSWMNSDGYDIEAKTDEPHNVDDLHTMFQNLLADRFNLKFHKETREGNVFALTVDKDGSKMIPNPKPEPSNIPCSLPVLAR